VAPDAGLLQAVRRSLTQRGWSTLAIVTPIAEPSAPEQRPLDLLPQGLGRVEAGLKHLQDQSVQPAALVGEGLGALIAIRFLAERPEAGIKAAVLIDAPSSVPLESAVLAALGKVKIPVLDILANRNDGAVPEAALQRRRIQGENPGYRQLVVDVSRAGYGELRETLGNLMHGWLSRTLDAPEPELKPAAPAPSQPAQSR
jgi:pimeloyl-ACP methyl ester carboxylesterase